MTMGAFHRFRGRVAAFLSPPNISGPDQEEMTVAVPEQTALFITDWPGGWSDFTVRSLSSVEGGRPPSRIPRAWPTRERLGILFANAPHGMGVPFTADQAFLPPPLVGTVKGATINSTRWPSVSAQTSGGQQQTVPAIYVGQQQ